MNDYQIQLETSKKDIPEIIRFLSEKNIDIQLIQPRHSLEDYFLKLTKSEKHVEPFTN
jgi:hypothetical protein